LTIARAARALSAFDGRSKVNTDDIEKVAAMSLRHRLRRDPLETIESGQLIEQTLAGLIAKLSTSPRLKMVK